MGLIEGVGKAKVFGKGNYLPGNFLGTLRVVKTLVTKSRKTGGMVFIAEHEVVESNLPDEWPAGKKASYAVKLGTDTTGANLRSWSLPVLGLSTDSTELDDELDDLINGAVAEGSEDDNDFTDRLVNIETVMVKTRAGNDFTRHDWSVAS